jgi:hypothetical protein
VDTRSKALIKRVIDDITARRLRPGDELGAAWSVEDSRAFLRHPEAYTEAVAWLTRTGVVERNSWPPCIASRLPARPEIPA